MTLFNFLSSPAIDRPGKLPLQGSYDSLLALNSLGLDAKTLGCLKMLCDIPAFVSIYTPKGLTVFQNAESIRCLGKIEYFGEHFLERHTARTAIARLQEARSFSLTTPVRTLVGGLRWHCVEVRPLSVPVSSPSLVLVCERESAETRPCETERLKLQRLEQFGKGIAEFTAKVLELDSRSQNLEAAIAIFGSQANLARITLCQNAPTTAFEAFGTTECWQWRAEREGDELNLEAIAVPVVIEGQCWGSLLLERQRYEATGERGEEWSDTERSLLELAARAIARWLAARSRSQQPKALPLNVCTNCDALTGLPNRTHFLEQLHYALTRSSPENACPFAVLLLDLNRFKTINDSLGRQIGDRVLIAIGERLRQTLNPNHKAARLGSDEFAILLPEARRLSKVVELAEHLHSSLSAPFTIDGQKIFTSASIGIALSTGYESAEEMLRDADFALDRAKERGSSPSEIFDRTRDNGLLVKLKLEQDLRQALQGLEDSRSLPFQLHYQPIVELTTGRIDGFEALVRWQHPQLGAIAPEQFISIAEQTGLIVSLGRWIFAEACRQLSRWRSQFPQHPPLSMSINLSSCQLADPHLLTEIDRILAQTDIPARSLKLEVTESALVNNADSAAKILQKLKDRQFQLCMDDFGTGYSSLNYLRRFPFDTLKIDRTFIASMEVETKHFAIVQTIVTLAGDLGMSIIPEGVETTAQRDRLQGLGCQLAQGYLFSQPLDTRRATQLLQAAGNN